MDWNELRVFLAIAREGTISSAATKLHVNHATVSRKLKAIEGRLGRQLFERVGKGSYNRTRLGEVWFNTALRMEQETLHLERSIANGDDALSGELRITIPPPLTALVMTPLEQFRMANPEVEVELVPTYDLLNLSRREADLALRFTESPPDHLVGRSIGKFASCAYGRRDIVQRFNILTEAKQINWIGWDDDMRYPLWLKGTPYPDLPVRHRFDDSFLQIEAARAGFGIAWLPCYMADPVEDLVRLGDTEPTISDAALWVLMHRDTRGNVRIREFIELLVNYFESVRDLIHGNLVGSR